MEGKVISYKIDLATQSVEFAMDLDKDGKPSVKLWLSIELYEEIASKIKEAKGE